MPKFLIILCENLGDGVCTTVAIRLLRDKFPAATIDALAINRIAEEVVENNPDFNQVYTVDKVEDLVEFAKAYTHHLVLIPTPQAMALAEKLQQAIIHAQAPKPAHLREVGVALIEKLFPEPATKVSSHYFLYPQEAHRVSIKEKLKLAGATFSPEERLIACHIGCNKAAKRALKLSFWKRKMASHRTWPFKRFYQLVSHYRKHYPNVRWVMTGSLGEQAIMKKYFKRRDDLIDLTAQTSILELAALMEYCHVFLSGDTGPMHVAGTSKIPMVSLFASTAPSVSGPWPLRDTMQFLVGKNRKGLGDISQISVKAVDEAIRKLL